MPQCCALNCKNRGIHIFPKELSRRKKWEDALCITNFKANDTARLCKVHFKEDDYFGKSKYSTGDEPLAKFLKKTAVPSIFSFTKTKLETPSPECQAHLEKRCPKKKFQKTKVPVSDFTFIELTPHVIGQKEEMICKITSNKVQQTESQSKFVSKSTQVDDVHMYGSIHRYKKDDKAIQFYTGFESYEKFYLVYSTLSPMVNKIKYYQCNLSYENQYFLTLMKLRQNKCNYELGMFFNISETLVSNIFITWFNFMYQLWSRINRWSDERVIQDYMPQHFKDYDKSVRVILDDTKIMAQEPKNPNSSQQAKHSNTSKVLVGKLMTECNRDDTISTERDVTIQDEFAKKDVTVKIPAVLKDKSQLPGLATVEDQELADKRVNVERIIGLSETYKILKSDLDHNYVPSVKETSLESRSEYI